MPRPSRAYGAPSQEHASQMHPVNCLVNNVFLPIHYPRMHPTQSGLNYVLCLGSASISRPEATRDAARHT